MKLNELLNIKYPLIQGGMANIATGEFAAAVSNVGALGLIASGGANLDSLREEIRICKSKTDKPFGVNLMLMHPDVEAMAELLIEEQVPVVTTGAGNPGKFVARWKEAGILIMPVVASVALAQRMERLGADAVIAEGSESGGHIGETTTMVLVPQIASAVKIPVIAAGGIATGKQLLAARALGAEGVQVGTCLLVAEECPIHPEYKKAILKAKDINITVIGRIIGAPIRLLKNKMVRDYLAQEKQGATLMELEEYTLGALRRAVFSGDTASGALMAGQVAAQIQEEKPLKAIIEDLFAEYNAELEKMKHEAPIN